MVTEGRKLYYSSWNSGKFYQDFSAAVMRSTMKHSQWWVWKPVWKMTVWFGIASKFEKSGASRWWCLLILLDFAAWKPWKFILDLHILLLLLNYDGLIFPKSLHKFSFVCSLMHVGRCEFPSKQPYIRPLSVVNTWKFSISHSHGIFLTFNSLSKGSNSSLRKRHNKQHKLPKE